MTRGGTSTAWRRARALAFQVYGNACVKCGEPANEIDHILEVDRGGTDDIENLQPLCSACHKAKTAKYNSERKKSINNGFFWESFTPQTPSLSYLSPKLSIEPPIAPKKR